VIEAASEHTTEDDHVGIGLRRRLRKLKGVRNRIRDFLHFRALIVMGQQNGVMFGAELPHALLLFADFLRAVVNCLHRRNRVARLE
jgi:hypothetical protein